MTLNDSLMQATEHLDTAGREVFALTDEQILELEPEGQEVESNPSSGDMAHASQGPSTEAATAAASAPFDTAQGSRDDRGSTDGISTQTGKSAQPGMAVPQEPPAWLAREMKDPWVGEEARELWEGVQ